MAQCLFKIMKKGHTQERIEPLLNDLIMECIHGSSLASRRGAAYGISAAVKGSGIASLKKYEVVKRLEEACTSCSPSTKEGALFCIKLLSSRLGILFEPYASSFSSLYSSRLSVIICLAMESNLLCLRFLMHSMSPNGELTKPVSIFWEA